MLGKYFGGHGDSRIDNNNKKYVEEESEIKINAENDSRQSTFANDNKSSERKIQVDDRLELEVEVYLHKRKQRKVQKKVIQEMRKLHYTWNPTLDDMLEVILVGGTDDIYKNSCTFQEAWKPISRIVKRLLSMGITRIC